MTTAEQLETDCARAAAEVESYRLAWEADGGFTDEARGVHDCMSRLISAARQAERYRSALEKIAHVTSYQITGMAAECGILASQALATPQKGTEGRAP